MKISTTELIYLNEAAKALKQREFVIINNSIVGLDNVDSYLVFINLDTNIFYNPDLNGLVFNMRELSAFVKTISIESEFEINQAISQYCIVTMVDKLIINNVSLGIYNHILEKINFALSPKTIMSPKQLINEEIQNVFALRKDDGCIYYKHNNKYMMTLFSGILPVNKGDKVYLTILPNNITSFISKFEIVKKKFIVNIYIAYLYM